eukprot:365629-Chlamydomonas_euryale.AAC.2
MILEENFCQKSSPGPSMAFASFSYRCNNLLHILPAVIKEHKGAYGGGKQSQMKASYRELYMWTQSTTGGKLHGCCPLNVLPITFLHSSTEHLGQLQFLVRAADTLQHQRQKMWRRYAMISAEEMLPMTCYNTEAKQYHGLSSNLAPTAACATVDERAFGVAVVALVADLGALLAVAPAAGLGALLAVASAATAVGAAAVRRRLVAWAASASAAAASPEVAASSAASCRTADVGAAAAAAPAAVAAAAAAAAAGTSSFAVVAEEKSGATAVAAAVEGSQEMLLTAPLPCSLQNLGPPAWTSTTLQKCCLALLQASQIVLAPGAFARLMAQASPAFACCQEQKTAASGQARAAAPGPTSAEAAGARAVAADEAAS